MFRNCEFKKLRKIWVASPLTSPVGRETEKVGNDEKITPKINVFLNRIKTFFFSKIHKWTMELFLDMSF